VDMMEDEPRAAQADSPRKRRRLGGLEDELFIG